jgi:hypothetical protein
MVVALGAAAAGGAFVVRRKLRNTVSGLTQLASFAASPALVPHDPIRDKARVLVARGGSPAANVDDVLAKLGGIGSVVGTDDVVIVKVSAQWWNQGMTNVAAVKRLLEHVLERDGFRGEVIVFENTHFRMPDGSGLSRAWVHPSTRNVDVPGWTKLGDLIDHFKGRVGFVGLVDGGASALADDDWMDATHSAGRYGGDGRGPIADGDVRDGYHWDFGRAFRLAKSWVDEARTPLTWPRFTSPRSGLVVDMEKGVLRREAGRLIETGRRLTWINMTTANEHGASGLTAACKSTMGVVDMSAGALGTHPLVRDYQSIHYFGWGRPTAQWRMAGPLADFARKIRKPDLILTVAEWVAYAPTEHSDEDIRLSDRTCMQARTVIAGTDPVAMDAWTVRNVMAHLPGANIRSRMDLDNPDATVTKFLRYYRQVYEGGTLDPTLIDVA